MTDQIDLFEEPKKTYTLNQGQQDALDWLVPFCLGEDIDGYRKVLLNGFAGTGKTFTINRVVEEVKATAKKMGFNVNFGMTAPTHKAVKVLKKYSELADELDFGTLHSFLGLKEQMIEQKDGSFKPEYRPDFERSMNRPRKVDGVDVLIIDESSMIQDDLFDFVEDEMRSNYGLRVIYMGDSKQIPPVGKKEATGEMTAIPFNPARQMSHHIKVLSLTEPQRQAADSPIIMYSVAIREAGNNQTIDYEFKEEDKEHIERMSPKGNMERMREIFLEYFDTEEFNADADHAKVIAYTNKTVDWANKEIRLLINKAVELPRIINDEKLIMDEPLMGKKKGDKEKSIIIPKNTDIIAENVRVEEDGLNYFLLPINAFARNKLMLDTGDTKVRKYDKIKVYKCDLIDEDHKRWPVSIIHEESEEHFNQVKEQIRAQAMKTQDRFEKKEMWSQYYKLKDQFAWVAYNYAITAHKCQGSTYQYAISMEWDMEMKCRDIEERNSLRYVAATRAKQKLWVIR